MNFFFNKKKRRKKLRQLNNSCRQGTAKRLTLFVIDNDIFNGPWKICVSAITGGA